MNVIEKIIAKQRATKDHFKQTVAHWLSYTCKGHDILRKYARIYAAPWGYSMYHYFRLWYSMFGVLSSIPIHNQK
jgi:hypothetical protein